LVTAAQGISLAEGDVLDASYLGSGHATVLQFEQFGGAVMMPTAGELLFDIDGWETIAYCVDKKYPVGSGLMTVDSITSLNRYREISYLYDLYAPNVDSDVMGAALAASFWECLYEAPENPLSLSGPEGIYWIDNRLNNPITQQIIDLGNAMLLSLSAMPDDYTSQNNLMVLRSDTRQDILVSGLFDPIGGGPGEGTPPAVPEPLTLTMLALGGAGLLIKLRRKAKA